MQRIIVFLILFIAMPGALPAQTSDEARAQLTHTLAALEASKEREKQIEEKTAKLERELKALQQEMVELARGTEDQETDLSSYEDKLAILEEQKKIKSDALNARQDQLSAILSSMVKLREVPPEAVIAMPGKLDETLETARDLGLITHAIEEEAADLKAQLRELDKLEEQIRKNREAVGVRRQSLAGRQKELETKVKERTRLQEELGGKEREERERAARLTSKSKSLQELLDTLQQSERTGTNVWERETPNATKRRETRAGKHTLRSFADADGKVQKPAAGKIVSRFGNQGSGPVFSKGIIIDTHTGGEVIAPYDGEVVFAGNFRDYGHMVIIRHSDGYHTLLSGLGEINCAPGQFLLAGEPVGRMGGAGETKLYVELREEGRPVDPVPWFRD